MSYYRNFETKDDLIKYYFEEVNYTNIQDYYPYKNVNIWKEDYAFSFFSGLQQIKDDVLLIDRIGKLSLLLEVFISKNIELAGDMPASSIDRYWLYYISGASLCAGIEWLKSGCKETPKEMAKSITGFMNSKLTEV